MMAIDAVNEGNGIPGYKIEPMVLDDGTSTAGQYDPAQAATNARKMVSDQDVVGALGPEMSGAGKAMASILSMGGLATIDAIKRVAASGKPVTREAVRDAVQATNVPTIQGIIAFDENGDLKDRTVSVFQIQQDKSARPDDVSRQYRYVGVAPQS
jgi:ABC-type branched-subunit amino acid transport system substrate-binding protein